MGLPRERAVEPMVKSNESIDCSDNLQQHFVRFDQPLTQK